MTTQVAQLTVPVLYYAATQWKIAQVVVPVLYSTEITQVYGFGVKLS